MRSLHRSLNAFIRPALLCSATLGWMVLTASVLPQAWSSTPTRTAAAPPTRIMPLGDSITQGNKAQNSYRRSLWRMLKQAGYAVDFVGSQQTNHEGPPPIPDFDLDNEGHWGWRIDEILTQLPTWARQARPDIVLVHMGTNDLAQQQDPAQTIAELKQVVQNLRQANPRVKILMAEIIPLVGNNDRFAAFNQQVRQLAQSLSTSKSPVITVDQFTGFQAEAGKDTFDGCHPNDSGEQKMATRWFTALRSLL
ncbi:MAG TPA: SGNH/GDSL hydrolase family protein [Stenomitos sp.]